MHVPTASVSVKVFGTGHVPQHVVPAGGLPKAIVVVPLHDSVWVDVLVVNPVAEMTTVYEPALGMAILQQPLPDVVHVPMTVAPLLIVTVAPLTTPLHPVTHMFVVQPQQQGLPTLPSENTPN